jgi:hypothetical protein
MTGGEHKKRVKEGEYSGCILNLYMKILKLFKEWGEEGE